MRTRTAQLAAGLALATAASLAGTAHASSVYVSPGNIGDGSISISGPGWAANAAWLTPTGYDFATNRHSYDLTGAGPVALQGFVDVSGAALANTNDWSKYYAKFAIRDSNDAVVNAVFANDWLGTWNEIDPHPWDRISLETENVPGFASNTPHGQQHYATEGGVLGRDMDGNWVGAGNGAEVHPSDRNYYFQLIADAAAQTLSLQVFGMGSSAEANPPDAWPKQNMLDEATWLEIGSIFVGSDFDFANVEFYSLLWASTQAGEGDTSLVSWQAMNVGEPISPSQSPTVIPLPAAAWAGLALLGAMGGVTGIKRKLRRN